MNPLEIRGCPKCGALPLGPEHHPNYKEAMGDRYCDGMEQPGRETLVLRISLATELLDDPANVGAIAGIAAESARLALAERHERKAAQ